MSALMRPSEIVNALMSEPVIASEVLRLLDAALHAWVPTIQWIDEWNGLPARMWMLREEADEDGTVAMRIREVWAISETCISVTDDDEAFCIDFTRESFRACHEDGAWVRPCWTPYIPPVVT